MKIIKQGILPQDKEYVHTCRYCSTVFTFKESDYTIESFINQTSYILNCPYCQNKLYIAHLVEHRT